MPDITMCLNTKCPLADTCYRSQKSGTVPSEYRQSVAVFKTNKDGTCDYYWNIGDRI